MDAASTAANGTYPSLLFSGNRIRIPQPLTVFIIGADQQLLKVILALFRVPITTIEAVKY